MHTHTQHYSMAAVMIVMVVALMTDDDSSDDDGNGSDGSLEGVAPTPKRRKHAREEALTASLNSGHYPTFQGVESSTNDLDPTTSSAFEYLEIVWPSSLCELMALETNRYAVQKGVSNWENTTHMKCGRTWASYY